MARRGVMPLVATVVGAGIAVRVAAYLTNRSFGLDESRAVLNVASRSWGELARPLDYDQSAPLLYLWLEKLATVLLGVNEPALRSVPLLAGMLLVAGMYPFARRFLSRRAAVLAAGLVAASPTLIFYANETKQYGLEALVAAGLTALAFDWFTGSKRSGLPLLLAGTVAVWGCAPAVFVLAAIVLASVASGLPRPAVRNFLVLAGLCWGVSFAVAYLAVYRGSLGNRYLMHYWEPAFLGPGKPELLKHLVAAVTQSVSGLYLGTAAPPQGDFAAPLQLVLTAVWIGIAVTGGARLARTRGPAAAIVVAAPILLAFGASTAGAYPFYLRLLLFATPSLFLMLAGGVESMAEGRPVGGRRALYLAAGLVLVGPAAWYGVRQAVTTRPPEHLRPLVRDLAARRAGEPIYIFAGTLPPWAFYSTDWSRPDRTRLALIARLASGGSAGPSFENAPARSGPVRHEADDLIYDTPAGRELYGISTGIEWNPMFGLLRRTTDPGWLGNEASRIADAASPGVWVLMSHTWGNERDVLAELERRHGRRTYYVEGNDILLARFRFDSATP